MHETSRNSSKTHSRKNCAQSWHARCPAKHGDSGEMRIFIKRDTVSGWQGIDKCRYSFIMPFNITPSGQSALSRWHRPLTDVNTWMFQWIASQRTRVLFCMAGRDKSSTEKARDVVHYSHFGVCLLFSIDILFEIGRMLYGNAKNIALRP